MEKILTDRRLYKFLAKVDLEFAEKVLEAGCENCGAEKLYRADYPRKPRGGVEEVVGGWCRRISFCCGVEGCRKRATPPSVRFLGRKQYLGVVVVLIAAMMHGPNARRVRDLHEALKLDMRTLKRWRGWWLETFVQSGFWKEKRARFMPVLDEAQMPYGLVDEFKEKRARVIGCREMVKLMRFLSPITTLSVKEAAAM